MKNLVVGISGVLLIVGSAAAQEPGAFYQICESKEQPYVDFRRDKIAVKTLTDESIEFDAQGTRYSARKVPGFNFLQGGSDVSRFYAYKVDDRSFFIHSVGIYANSRAFAYYHADQRKKGEPDNNTRCALDDFKRFDAAVRSFQAQQQQAAKQAQSQFDSQTTGVITEWTSKYASKKSDPALEKGILAWWKGAPTAVVINPILRIAFMQPSYEMTRNEFGVVLRKTVDAFYVFKKKDDGKCYVNWRSFGYEATGGGTFSNEVKDWIKQDRLGAGYVRHYIPLAGERHIQAGLDYEVTCAAFRA